MTAKNTTKQKEVMFRTNTRIRMDQQAFIKKAADKAGIGEGEQTRIMLDFYITNNKKNK